MSKEMFTIDQGVRQGGAFSDDLYKIYINPLLNILSTSGLGGRVGNINCCAPTCADDLALVSNNPLDLKIMMNIPLDFSKREGYVLQPTKSVVIPVKTCRKFYEIKDGFWKLNGKNMPIISNASHIGIQKSDKDSAVSTVNENIKKARRAMYSLMGTGLHGENGLDTISVSANLKDIRKIPLRLKISTGNYILQTHKASFSKNHYISPTCKLCCKADETVEHFILLCEKLEEARIPLSSNILDNGSLILAKVATSLPIDLIQLIINPFCYVDINAKRTVFEETSNILEPLCRQLLYNLHNKRYALLANIDKQGSRKSTF
ncbi:Hypothetical predicted protein [Mytilus galloprovincialis]|uniref:Reverse transcriptase domain-containing protein n=1 Tax=Mytilus galloprovincialis TaxID=29158 RepID=A0A8B6GWX2_MYTGA|nr:Hypothetical predicted protein [Mytilus galloprovincialis]